MNSDLGDWEAAKAIYKLRGMTIIQQNYGDMTDYQCGTRDLYLNVGSSKCAYHLGDYEKSIELGKHAVAINSSYKDVYKYVILSYKALGDTENAKKMLAEAMHYETPFDEKHRENLRKMYEQEYLCSGKKE